MANDHTGFKALSDIDMNGNAITNIGGLDTAMTLGSVLFAGTNGIISQDNSNLFWDDTNNRLGIGVATPTNTLDVNGNINTNSLLRFSTGTTNKYHWQYFTNRLTVTETGVAERFVILDGGNFGINTATPASELCINGGLHVGGDSDAGDNNLLVDGVATITGTTTSTGLFTASAGANFTGTNANTHIHYQPDGTQDMYLRAGKTSAKINIQDNHNGDVKISYGGGTTYLGGSINIVDAKNITLGTTTGTKIGTGTTQKLGFFNATPIVQQTTTSQTPSTFVANTSSTVDDSATWDGYTIGDIVKILRAFGLIA